MKRFLLIAACAFLSLGFLSSCQKEESSVLDLARELTKELKTVTDHQTAEAAAPRVAALNKRLQNAMARPYAANLGGSSLLRSSDTDTPEHEGALLAEALTELAREMGRVQASLPVERSSDADVSVPHLRLSVGVANGAQYTDSTSVRYGVADKHMHGEEDENAMPYPKETPYCYGSPAMATALEYTVSPSSIPFFTFDSADDVVATPASANAKPEDTAESGDAAPADGDDTPATDDSGSDDSGDDGDDGDDGDTDDGGDDTPAVTPATDDGGLPSLGDDETPTDDGGSDDAGDDDGGSDDSGSDDAGDDDGGLDLGDLDL